MKIANISAAIWLVVVAHVFAAEQSQQPPPAPSETIQQPNTNPEQNGKSTNYNQNDSALILTTKKLIPPNTANQQAAENPEHQENYASAEWWLVYLTAALCTVTAGLAIFTAFLWGATKKIVKSSEQIARQQMRAFVFAKGFNSAIDSSDGKKIRNYLFSATYENVGITPGTDARYWIKKIKVATGNKEEVPKFIADDVTSATVMGPRSMAETGFLLIPLQEMIEIWERKINVFIWSRVEYRDIFDSSVLHHHEQCARIELIHEPSTLPPSNHSAYVRFPVCGPQNTTS
ncbi:MAG: hypothetical protein ACHBNF_22735 [Chromatiales bacterium]